jgi:inner membrane protease subunit 1
VFGTFSAVVAGAVLFRLTRYEIAEESMEPTLSEGDWVVGLKRPKGIRRGDVIVFEHPRQAGFDLVKRVGAAPRGRIHGRTMSADELWVESDNPVDGSVDSRILGPIPLDLVRARVLARYKPLPPSTIPVTKP